ncbi:hypothetical protein C3L33_12074, partial [Rhododendron williamsianum]
MATREGLVFATMLEVGELEVDGDSLKITRMIKQEEAVHQSTEAIIEDIRRLMRSFVNERVDERRVRERISELIDEMRLLVTFKKKKRKSELRIDSTAAKPDPR